MPAKTLLVLPSSSGLPVSIASLFSVRGFTHVLLIGSDAAALDRDEDAVLDAIQERGYSCQTKTVVGEDLDTVDGFERFWKEKEDEMVGFGDLEVVLYHDRSDQQSPEVFGNLVTWSTKAFEDNNQGSPTILVVAAHTGAGNYQKCITSESDIHVALIRVKTDTSDDKVAQRAWELYQEQKGSWSTETEV